MATTPKKQQPKSTTLERKMARSPKIRALRAERDALLMGVVAAGLRRQNQQLSILTGQAGSEFVDVETGYAKQRRRERDRQSAASVRESFEMPGRQLTPDYFGREAGYGGEAGWMGQANPGDRYKGANRPVFEDEAGLRRIKAIGRFYTEFDEVGLGLRDNVVNYTGGEAINYVCEALEKKGNGVDVAKNVQRWIDGFITQNRWAGLREKEPMRTAFADGESLMLLHVLEDLEYPDVQLQDCTHLVDPKDMATQQSDRLGFESLDWEFGVGTLPGRQDRPLAYFFDWYGQNDYQLLPSSRVIHVKLNVPEDVKRGVCDPFVAHRSLKIASVGVATTAKQAAIQATIAYIEKLAADAPLEKVNQALMTPDIMSELVTGLSGRSQTVQTQEYMGAQVIRTNELDFQYGPVGAPQGSKLVEVFNAVLRRVAVRWQFSDWMVTGDPSNNNMASSVVAETPFHRSTRTRQGLWADYYEQLLKKAIELAMAVGRGPEGIPADPKQLWKIVSLRVKMPDPKERDLLEEADIYQIEHQNRIISAKTWRENRGYDHETEEANLAEEDAAALERSDAEAAIMAKHEIATANGTPPKGAPAGGRDSATRNRVIVGRQKKAQAKAKAQESLQDPRAFQEAAAGADWDDSTRREIAASVLYDRSDDN